MYCSSTGKKVEGKNVVTKTRKSSCKVLVCRNSRNQIVMNIKRGEIGKLYVIF
jgi:hypothetical protein